LHIDACDAEEPPLMEVGGGHLAACIRSEELVGTGTHAEEIFDATAVDDLLITSGSDGTVAEVGSSSGQGQV
jgi:peptide/nickel transport system ATP-binding protein